MSFRRLFSEELSQTASSSSFVNTFGDTATNDLPLTVDLNALSGEAGQIVEMVRYKLGEPVVTVYMDNSQIFLAFELANQKYSAIVNTYQARSWMIHYYGLSKDFNVDDLTGKLPRPDFNFLKRMTENVAGEISPPVGGNNPVYKAYTTLAAGQQDYSVYDDFVDYESGVTIRQAITSLTGAVNSNAVEFKNVYHYPATTLYRFYDPYSSVNLLSQEFNFESFNTESIFYVLPIWTDILRAQQLNMNDKVRRSNYSYEKIGDRFRVFPAPTNVTNGLKLYIDYSINTNAFDETDPQSVSGISNFTQIPFTDIAYDKINAPGRTWIRDYTMAICMEMEGRIRRKWDRIPIPGDSIQLDGTTMVAEGITLMQQLEEKLREDLDKLTVQNVMKEQAEMADALKNQYKNFPEMIWMF